MDINKFIDHTCLKQGATNSDIEKLCKEAIEYQFATVCVPPFYVKHSKLLLKDDVKVCTVIGFPFGYSTAEIKEKEIQDAIENGADEIDIVQNVSLVKNGDWVNLYREIELFLYKTYDTGVIVKVILESGILTDNEIIKCCEIYSRFNHKIHFIKTSTGFAENGASVQQIELIKKNIPDTMFIKASGGIRDYKFTKELIDAGATRIGTSSGVKIINESKQNEVEYFLNQIFIIDELVKKNDFIVMYLQDLIKRGKFQEIKEIIKKIENLNFHPSCLFTIGLLIKTNENLQLAYTKIDLLYNNSSAKYTEYEKNGIEFGSILPSENDLTIGGY